MEKIGPGLYWQIGAPGLGFTVYLYENREWHQRTQRFRMVRFWSFRVGDYVSSGHATRRAAQEAAVRFTAQREVA